MTYCVDTEFLKKALPRLQGSHASDRFCRLYLAWKRLGMTTRERATLTSVGDDERKALERLMKVDGLDLKTFKRRKGNATPKPVGSAYFYDPFMAETLNEDYPRSGLQTRTYKVLKGTDQGGAQKISSNGTWLEIVKGKKVGTLQPYHIRMLDAYPVHLGKDRVGFAMADGEHIRVPMRDFLAWLHRYSEWAVSPEYSILRTELIEEFHFTEAEVGILFDEQDENGTLDDVTTVGTNDSVHQEAVLQTVIDGFAENIPLPATRPLTEEKRNFLIDLYTTPQMREDPFYSEPSDQTIAEAVRENLNVLLVGPPGTGKTHRALNIALDVAGSKDRVVHLQLNEGYDYEQFVESREPEADSNGKLKFVATPKVFKQLAQEAEKHPELNYVLVLDEINRAEISKVLGEAFSLIERSYRLHYDGTSWQGTRIRLVYSEGFGLPNNIYILATMNDIDGTTFELDYALMRRFRQFRIEPSQAELKRMLISAKAPIEVQDAALMLFSKLQSHHPIGHAYLNGVDSFEGLRDAYAGRIRPALRRSLGRRKKDDLELMDQIVLNLIDPQEE